MKYLAALSLASFLPLAYSTAIARRTVSDKAAFAIKVQGFGTLHVGDDFSLCLQLDDEAVKYAGFGLAKENAGPANIACDQDGCQIVSILSCPVQPCGDMEVCLAQGSPCLYIQDSAAQSEGGCVMYSPHQGAEPSIEKIKKALTDGCMGKDGYGISVSKEDYTWAYYPFGSVVEN